MPTKIVLGAQWGDEGKAKIVDYLTVDADYVVRFQGGANAGHTVMVGDDTFVFHVIPAGILHEDKACVVSNGVVLDPEVLIAEVDELAQRGVSTQGRLFISHSAHLVMPYHKALDKAGLTAVDRKGFVFNPITWSWRLSDRDLSVNYVTASLKPE